MQTRDIYVTFKGCYYHIRQCASLTDLKVKARKYLDAQDKQIVFFTIAEDKLQQVTEANFREVSKRSGLLTFIADFSAEPAFSRSNSVVVRMDSSSSFSSSNSQQRERSATDAQSTSSSVIPKDSGYLCSAMLEAAANHISAVHLRDMNSLGRAQVLLISRLPKLEALTLERFVANSECWREFAEVVRSTDTLTELSLTDPSAEWATYIVEQFLQKPSCSLLFLKKAAILQPVDLASSHGMTALMLHSVTFLNPYDIMFAPSLKTLTLSRCRLGPSRLGLSLRTLVNLETLNLAGNNLGQKIAVELRPALSKMRDLRALDLSKNFIRNEGVIGILSSLRSQVLESLDLSWSAASQHFTEFANIPLRLKSYRLSHNPVTLECFLALSDFIQNLPDLEELGMAHCTTDAQVVQRLMSGQPQASLKVLDLSGNDLPENQLIMQNTLRRFPRLQKLRLAAIGSDFVEFFRDAYAPELTELDLSLSEFRPNCLTSASFSLIDKLATLRLSTCGLSQTSGAVFLPKGIVHLDLSYNNLLTNKQFPAFINFQNLKTLNLRGNGLGKQEAEQLFAGLAKAEYLRKLDLSFNRLEIVDIIRCKNVMSLESLKAANNRLQFPARQLFSKLAALTKLKKVDFSGNQLTFSFLDQFEVLLPWTKLNLNDNPMFASFSHGERELVALFFHAFPHLTSLKLCNTHLGNYIVPLLMNLNLLSWLQKLCISRNSLSPMFLERGDQLPELRCLQVLKLAHIEDEQKLVTMLAQLASSKGLEKLNISGNSLKYTGLNLVSEQLRRFSALRVLNLSYNEIIELPEQLIWALKLMVALEELDLSHNEIAARGVIQLWMLANDNSLLQLRRLNLAHNHIPNKGALYLSRLLSTCPCLSRLNVSCNLISHKYISILTVSTESAVALPRD